eukprot:TRINITY_DN5299_c2_g1_i1.p1 TRINITY_DN5299_c2_g1~~TRINITY_DN5299_c2_g1_i1.p1  ORF type:complete len:201 (+),score=41.66 TRINITY_DN5299_c2_g1_i1:60-662(+)
MTVTPAIRCKDSINVYSSTKDLPVLVEKITSLLECLCKMHDSEGYESVFDCAKVPVIGIKDYIMRLCLKGGCTTSALITMVVYIDRLFRVGKVRVTRYNVHRVVLVTFVAAIKSYSDAFYSNKYYCVVGGVQLRELNKMEAAFLTLVNWNLLVDTEFPIYQLHFKTRLERVPPKPQPRALPAPPVAQGHLRCPPVLPPIH